MSINIACGTGDAEGRGLLRVACRPVRDTISA